ENARTLLMQASEIDPNSQEAWMWLASISDYPEELLALLNRVLDIVPDNARALEWRAATTSLLAKSLVQRAVNAHDDGSGDLAFQCLDNAIDLDPNCEMAWFWKASLSDDDEKKVGYLEHVLRINTKNAEAEAALTTIHNSRFEALMDRACQAAVAGDLGRSVELVDQGLQQRPESVDAWMLRSHLSTDLDEKIVCLEQVLKLQPDDAAACSSHKFLTQIKQPKEDKYCEQVEDDFKTMYAGGAEPSAVVDYAHDLAEKSFDEDGEALTSPEKSAEVDPYSEQNIRFDSTDDFSIHDTDEPEWMEEVADEDVVGQPTVTAQESFGKLEEAAETDSPSQNRDVAEVFESDAMSPADIYEENVEAFDAITAEFDVPAYAPEPEGEESTYHVEFDSPDSECPFCMAPNDTQAFECDTCHAMLTLSDMESLLANPRVVRDLLQHAVARMEAEWNSRDFTGDELTSLGIGHLNLGNYDAGRKYLEEASSLDPNNVILAGQVRAIAIRIDELSYQNHRAMPKGKTILVVDDSATVRKLISGKLEKSGHRVVCAEDGVEALARMEDALPDLVLLDINMPRMDGYEVCKHIRANPAAKDLPVVMITGKDGFFDKVRGRMAGTTGYVTKPFGPETLMKAIETYLVPDAATVG
ncbi:MAG: response regulator, partial [Pyrinomonadaceae bacterium]